MRRSVGEVPEAWREAAGDEGVERELAAMLPNALGRADRAEGLARLLGAVSQLPLRYAPFSRGAAALWDISEYEVDAIFTKAGRLSEWQRTPLPGVRLIEVAGGPRTLGADAFMVRFAPGILFPRHRHIGSEDLLVLEGSYTDTLGRVVQPGDLHQMQPGTEHGFRVGKEGPCIGAAVQNGREFTGAFMRLLASVFDRKASRHSRRGE
jgi:quercetin dioxygenase-like cupin family protein